MISLKGKNAIITGAGRGIGQATAIALAKEGVNLGLIGLNGLGIVCGPHKKERFLSS